MQDTKRLTLATTAFLAATMGVAGPSAAADLTPCDTFTLLGVMVENSVVDVGPEGESLGDVRIGERELTDTDGNVVGTVQWSSTLVDLDHGPQRVDEVLGLNAFALPDGDLYAQAMFDFKSGSDPGADPTRDLMAVIGGTGAYVRSGGQIEATFEPGKPGKFEFQLYCD